MDSIIEIIFTLVVGFFWLFGSSFFKSRGNDEPSSSQQNRRSESDSDAREHEARQQEIRESILRKIAERRQQEDAGPVIASEPNPYYQESYKASSEPEEDTYEPLVHAESTKEETPAPNFSLNMGGTLYEETMQERLQKIEATKRKAEALRKKAEKVRQGNYQIYEAENTEQEDALFVGSVRAALKNPRNARAAFIYGEVLGKPISLRNSSDKGLGV